MSRKEKGIIVIGAPPSTLNPKRDKNLRDDSSL
jgi:hypothetical protein